MHPEIFLSPCEVPLALQLIVTLSFVCHTVMEGPHIYISADDTADNPLSVLITSSWAQTQTNKYINSDIFFGVYVKLCSQGTNTQSRSCTQHTLWNVYTQRKCNIEFP